MTWFIGVVVAWEAAVGGSGMGALREQAVIRTTLRLKLKKEINLL
jgi:hypothetical protein